MTATFGKLEHQTLNFQQGLNIIEAPNEWGKSTWCAFLISMLYGIDTKERTTQKLLADKERYAPWSGAPMEGRMEICWKGRDITIERRTKGRLIFGDFRAYETETGLDIPELTATNCGTQLLGVERSVFTRAGFLKLSDLPLTQDDALRRRLNSLVTTGDESGSGEKLAQSLKDLKNKCRWNQKGLLPQAEAERDKLEEQLRGLQDLNLQAQRLQERQQELDTWISKLENHKAALQYAQVQADNRHIQEEIAARDAAKVQLEQKEAVCRELPSFEEVSRARSELQRLQNESMALQMEQQMLPFAPVRPECAEHFSNMTGTEAVEMAKADAEKAGQYQKARKNGNACAVIGIVAIAAAVALGIGAYFMSMWQAVLAIGAAAFLAAGLCLLIVGGVKKSKAKLCLANIVKKHGAKDSQQWLRDAEQFAQAQLTYEKEMLAYSNASEELRERKEELVAQIQQITKGESVADCLAKWEDLARQWNALEEDRRDLQRRESQVAVLLSMAKDVSKPQQPDELTHTMAETDALLSSAAFEQKQNQLRLGQFQGQAEALGQESALRAQLKQIRQRIDSLEDTYLALELAQKALGAATSELQRRFAPRISKRAQELFERFTSGRYQRITLGEDLSVNASAQQEDTLRSSQWRSDGTVDQMYLALRLAVAEELTPDAPLVLDDALVRFDDARLATALHILQEMAEHKQVILFTCQSREKKLQGDA